MARSDFRDQDGQPLISWGTPEEAFEAWKKCSCGRPCDYSGLSYDLLHVGSEIPWLCTAEAPKGTDRLYGDSVFPTDPSACEDFGHDLLTDASTPPEQYKSSVIRRQLTSKP